MYKRQILLACECDARGRLGLERQPYAPRPRLLAAFRAAQGVCTALVAEEALARGLQGPRIAEAIHEARVRAVAAGLPDMPAP